MGTLQTWTSYRNTLLVELSSVDRQSERDLLMLKIESLKNLDEFRV